MDYSKGENTGVFQAGLLVVVLLLVLSFFVFKYGKSKDVVYNQQVGDFSSITREQVLESLKQEKNSPIWDKYIDKIFDQTKTPTQDLSTAFQKELEEKTLVPMETVVLQGKIVGNSFAEKSKYLNEFENLFITARKKGVFSESKIFADQALPGGKVLLLSDYDKETVLRFATEYELWAKSILNLQTPSQYESKSLRAAQDLFQIAYILRKAMQENDEQVYVMWIGKYTQKVFDILGNRYVK